MAGTVNGRYRYAFALPSFLLVISLLMILLGAFVATQRSNFALLKSSADSDKSLATCHAVYEYVRYRLEHDKTWGKTPFQGLTDDRLGSGLTVVEKPGTRHLRGTLAGLDTTFEAELYYNLDSESEHSGLPPESARLIVDAHSLTRSAHSEALFHVAPLFDSSVLSRGKVGIDASSLSVRSRDPYRNNIRAEGAIDVPEVLGNDPRTLFLKPDSNTTDPRGIIWSRDHISSAGVDLNGHIQEANANSGGTFLPEANQQFQIFDLQPDQLVSPPNVVEIGAGEYRFTMVNAVVTGMATVTGGPPGEDGVVPTRSLSFTVNQDIEVLEYYKNPNSTRPTEVYRSATRTDDIDEDSIKMQVVK